MSSFTPKCACGQAGVQACGICYMTVWCQSTACLQTSCKLCDSVSSGVRDPHLICGNTLHKHTEQQQVDWRNIESDTKLATAYRRVVYTDDNMQLVLMCVTPEVGGIPRESHHNATQFIRVEEGTGVLRIWKSKSDLGPPREYALSDGISVTVHPDTEHEVHVTGTKPLKLYTLYAPPQHKAGLVQMEPGPEEEDD